VISKIFYHTIPPRRFVMTNPDCLCNVKKGLGV
jgi:hypothetical protein